MYKKCTYKKVVIIACIHISTAIQIQNGLDDYVTLYAFHLKIKYYTVQICFKICHL